MARRKQVPIHKQAQGKAWLMGLLVMCAGGWWVAQSGDHHVARRVTVDVSSWSGSWLGTAMRGPSREQIARSEGHIVGRVRMLRGGALDVGGVRVRLDGVVPLPHVQACPAEATPCATSAADVIAQVAGSAEAVCKRVEGEGYGAVFARCSVGVRDLGLEMVTAGFARAASPSNGYAFEESRARRARRGAWRAGG